MEKELIFLRHFVLIFTLVKKAISYHPSPSGFLHPELSDGAQHFELEEVAREDYDGYYSVARTCEIGLSQRSGKNYESIVYLVEEATR